jgi:hypothetical protein
MENEVAAIDSSHQNGPACEFTGCSLGFAQVIEAWSSIVMPTDDRCWRDSAGVLEFECCHVHSTGFD